MRFALTDEQIEFSEAVRGLLADTCKPEDVRSAWPDAEYAGGGTGTGTGRVPSAWAALGEMGVLGVTVPESHGGLGMTDEDLSPLLVEAGRVALPDPLAATAGVAVGALRSIAESSTDPTAGGLLEAIASGLASVGVMFSHSSERIAGSNLVPSVASLDSLVVFGDGSVSLIERDAISFEPVESVDGARALSRVTTTAGTALVDGVAADSVAADGFNRAALYAASELVGLSERMVELAVDYAAERQQFGVPIGSFQAVKHLLANAAMQVEFARPLVMRAAHSVTNSDPNADQHVSMAKARASQAADAVARAALQVHGGIGYTVEYDLHLFMKRAWALSREFGDARFHTRRVRRSLTLA